MTIQMTNGQEYATRHTFKLVLESRRGETREFPYTFELDRLDDGDLRVRYAPDWECEPVDGELIPYLEANEETFGLDWNVVEISGFNSEE